MLNKLKGKITFVIILLSFSQISLSQNEGDRLFKNPLFPGNSNNASVSPIELENTSIDDLVNYFDEKRKTPSYKYVSEFDNKTWVVSILDPMVFMKQELQNSLSEIPYTHPLYFESNDKIVRLLLKMDNLDQINKVLIKESTLKKLSDDIEILQSSKEKVNLLLRLENLKINSKNFYQETEKAYQEASKIIESIHNKFDKGISFMFLGDFLNQFQANLSALSAYYSARENIYNSNRPDSVKNQLQAVLCEQIARTFYSETIPLSILKSLEYNLLATKYYTLAHKKDEIERSALNLIGLYFYQGKALRSFFSDTTTYRNSQKAELIVLQKWLDEYDARPSDNDAINYYGIYGVAVACRNYEKYNAALNYFIEALYYSIKLKNYIFIRSSIANITSIYGQLNERDKADRFVELLSLFEPKWKNVSRYNKAIQKAGAYSNGNRFDSALMKLNEVQFDTALMNSFIPSFTRRRYQEINVFKTTLLYKLKSDSAHIYENYTHYDQEFYNNEFAQLLKQESKSISDWLENEGEKELLVKEELVKLKESNNRILEGQNKLLDSLVIFNEENAKLKNDSLQREKFYRNKDSIYYNDTLNKSNAIRELENKNAAAEIKLKNYFILTALSLGIIIVISVWQINKQARRKQQNEIERINNLTKINIHNFQNEYATFGNLIEDGNLEKLTEYEQYYGAYLQSTYANWKQSKVTLKNELIAGENYFYSKQIRMPGIKLIQQYDVNELENVRFLQSVFDTVIHNSFKYGFKTRDSVGEIKIAIEKAGQFLICNISDTGTPPQSEDKYLVRENSGLNLLKARIKNTYLQARQQLPKDFFSATILPNNTGTNIKIKLLYEEV